MTSKKSIFLDVMLGFCPSFKNDYLTLPYFYDIGWVGTRRTSCKIYWYHHLFSFAFYNDNKNCHYRPEFWNQDKSRPEIVERGFPFKWPGTLGIARRSLGLTLGYQSGFIHGIFIFNNKFGFWGSTIIFLWNWKPWMFSEDYKRGVFLDDLDVGLDWNALIKGKKIYISVLSIFKHDFQI